MNLHLFWDKILDFFALNNHTDETDDIIENPENTRVVSIYKQQGYRIMVHSPESFAEVQSIVDQLKLKKPIILNLEELDRDMARRIVDFISGAVYGLDGNVKKLSDAVFIFTPNNIKVDGDIIKKTNPFHIK